MVGQRRSPSMQDAAQTVMLYIRFPLSLRNVEDLLHERGLKISHETVRFWWNRFCQIFAVTNHDSGTVRTQS